MQVDHKDWQPALEALGFYETMKEKKFGKLDFKKYHPSGSLGAKLKTVEDLMLTGNKIPFINEKNQIKKL